MLWKIFSVFIIFNQSIFSYIKSIWFLSPLSNPRQLHMTFPWTLKYTYSSDMYSLLTWPCVSRAPRPLNCVGRQTCCPRAYRPKLTDTAAIPDWGLSHVPVFIDPVESFYLSSSWVPVSVFRLWDVTPPRPNLPRRGGVLGLEDSIKSHYFY